jgi:DNA invertase Pin-like site-specific DNA recombinase
MLSSRSCAAGCTKMFREKVSGVRSDRAELVKVLKALGQGDTLIVSRLDRLARSTRDLLNIPAAIGERGATSSHWATHGPTQQPRTGA